MLLVAKCDRCVFWHFLFLQFKLIPPLVLALISKVILAVLKSEKITYFCYYTVIEQIVLLFIVQNKCKAKAI